jgi:hypothetical protein
LKSGIKTNNRGGDVRRQRLRSVKALMAESIRELSELAADETQSQAKRAVAILTKADLIRALYISQAEERKVAVKAGISKPDEPKKPEPSTTPSVPTQTESLEDKLRRRGIEA